MLTPTDDLVLRSRAARRNGAPLTTDTTTRRTPTDREVLAALERALRNEETIDGGIWLSEVAQHLAITWHSGTARILQPIMARLSNQGLVRQSRRNSTLWTLTDDGRKQVAHASVTLPESPQRRRWRQARELAEEHRHQMLQDLIAAIIAATELINACEPVTAKDWQQCGELLTSCCDAMAHVNFALNESVDPKDGPAMGERWIDFWVQHGLIWRHVTLPRKRAAARPQPWKT